MPASRATHPSRTSIAHDTYTSSVRTCLLIPAFAAFNHSAVALRRVMPSLVRPVALHAGRSLPWSVRSSAAHATRFYITTEAAPHAAPAHRSASSSPGCSLLARSMRRMCSATAGTTPAHSFVEQPLDSDPLALTARDTLLAVAHTRRPSRLPPPSTSSDPMVAQGCCCGRARFRPSASQTTTYSYPLARESIEPREMAPPGVRPPGSESTRGRPRVRQPATVPNGAHPSWCWARGARSDRSSSPSISGLPPPSCRARDARTFSTGARPPCAASPPRRPGET
jgi:hypothetical protein